ncbi:ribonuclease HII [Aneurinibacillus terranovensis]|uniref:ribonuclease HII n=1 Tax=Aneurinibacillus terranovensis TaxID=278991 RepID=UPI000427735C|nr:ribonuclease HII [Aneurinibacillus terranovensis]
MNIHKMSIKEIKDYLLSCEGISAELEKQIQADTRSGVEAAYKLWLRKKEKTEQLYTLWHEMSAYERGLWSRGHSYIAGVDEVGRGPLAGPVVTAAVILPETIYLPGLNDSKKVSPAKREELYKQIRENAIAVSVGISDHHLIDTINIYQATLRAMSSAVHNLPVAPTVLLNDAVTIPGVPMRQIPIIGGDAKSISIAAASIIAKVERDRMMAEYDQVYPGYGFSRNMGYGTAEHLDALKVLGPSPIHRRSFAGVLQPAGET